MNRVTDLTTMRFPAWLRGGAVSCNNFYTVANPDDFMTWFAWQIDATHAGVGVFSPGGGRSVEPVLPGEVIQALRGLGLIDPDAASWSWWPRDEIEGVLALPGKGERCDE